MSHHLKFYLGKTFKLAAPICGSRIVVMLGSFFGYLMIARLGHTELAAGGLISAAQTTAMVITISILFSISAVVGRLFGSKDYQTIGTVVQQGWLLSLLICIPLMLVYWFMGPILALLGQKPELVVMITPYFHIYELAVIPMSFLVASQQFCFGAHRPNLVLVSNFLSSIFMIIFSYAFIFGKLGAPKLGVNGLALATAIQAWMVAIFMLLCFTRKSFAQYQLFQFRQGYQYLVQLFKLGWPICINLSSELLSFLALSVMVGWIGVNQLGAYQIVNQFVLIVLVPLFALSQASGVLVSQSVGAKKPEEVKIFGHVSLAIGMSLVAIFAACFILFPNQLSSFYLRGEHVDVAVTQKIAVTLFLIFAINQVFDGVRNILAGALRGLYDMRYPMIASIIAIWVVAVPMAYILGFVVNWGVVGVAIGDVIGIAVGSVLLVQRWRMQLRKL